MSDSFLSYSATSAGVPKYTSFASLPAPAGSSRGDMAVTIDTDTLYEFNGTAWVVVGVAGSTVVAVTDTATIDLTNTSGNLSAAIVNSSITDALVSPTAAIGLSKLATGALPSGITVDSSNIVDGSIVNSDVSPTAAIDASKIADGSVSNAEFQRLDGVTSGIQGQIDGKVAKTGDSVSGDLTFASGFGIESTSAASSLDIGTTSNTATLNLGTGAHTNTINIGTGAGTTTINIGGAGDTVAVAGTLATVNTTNLDVTDKLITVNKDGLASSGFTSGISIEENGSEAGYIRSNATRDGIELKAPAAAGNIDLRPGSANTVITSNVATSDKTITIPNVTGTLITTGDTATVTDTMLATGISRSKLAAGSADHVLINDGSGNLSSEASLAVTRGGTGQSSVTTGDLLYGSGVNTISKLPIGSANQVLTVSGGLPSWQPGLSDPMTTAGDMIIRNGSNITARLPVGSNGQVLASDGTIPAYTDTLTGKEFTGQVTLSGTPTAAAAGKVNIGYGGSANTWAFEGANGFAGIFSTNVITADRTFTLPNVSGTLITTGDTGTVTSTMIADGTIVNADISGSAAIDGSKIVAASALVPGVVTTGTQTIAGAKTLLATPVIESTTTSASLQFTHRNYSGPGSRTTTITSDSPSTDVTRLSIDSLVSIPNSTASTSSTNGALVVTGGLGVGEALNMTGDLRIGSNRGSNGAANLLFQAVSGAASTTAQIERASGANGNFNILNTGTGVIDIRNSAGTSTGQGVAVQGYRNGALTAGYVGETKISQLANHFTIPTGGYAAATGLSMTLEAGIWMISGTGYTINNATGQQVWWCINTAAADSAPLMVYKYYQPNEAYIAGIGPFVVAHASTQVYNFYTQCSGASISGGLLAGYTQIRATRIA